MFPRYRQGETVQLTDGRTGTVEFVVFDGYEHGWLYWVRVLGDLVLTNDDGLKAVADDAIA